MNTRKSWSCALALALSASPALAGGATNDAPVMIPTPPKGKGEVVFFRPGSIVGAAVSCAVSENGHRVSSLARGRYFVVVAEPGKHTYSVSSEAKDELTLEVEADEVQYATCRIKMGIMAGRPDLRPVTAADFAAQKGLSPVPEDKLGEGALRADGSVGGAASGTAGTSGASSAASF